MCGIAGAAWVAGARPLEFAALERMTSAIAHRGPDDAGYYHSWLAPNGAGRDLSGILPDAGGHGPANLPGAALG
ncbi:MAG TPA: hypothetical protein VKU82_07875, partial [Planctomycetaceae bacterium]|nr:hypothetical protein [Planctomycetaceae bacterium]